MQDDSLNLPVSLAHIREALTHLPVEPLRGLNDHPHFRVIVAERQKFQALVDALKFETGPVIPGGLYGYDQQQRLFPSVDNPLVQPYAAFNGGEIATLTLEALIGHFLAQRIFHPGNDTKREREAREEVERALAEFLTSQSTSSISSDK
jgi:hypothetical protein